MININDPQEVAYVTAPSREEVLRYWFSIKDHMPVDWTDKQSIKSFQTASDKYAKTWSRLSMADQGWVCECISHHNKTTSPE